MLGLGEGREDFSTAGGGRFCKALDSLAESSILRIDAMASVQLRSAQFETSFIIELRCDNCCFDTIPPHNMLFGRYCDYYHDYQHYMVYDSSYPTSIDSTTPSITPSTPHYSTMTNGKSIPTSQECSYYSNGVRSKYESNVACTKCITGAKFIMNLNCAQINDTETLRMRANKAIRTMGEAEIWFSSSKSSVAMHWTTLLHYMLTDLKVDGYTNRTLDRISKAHGGQIHAHKALGIVEQMDKHMAELKERYRKTQEIIRQKQARKDKSKANKNKATDNNEEREKEKTVKEISKEGSVLEGGEAIPHRHLSAADLSGQGSALHCRCTEAEKARKETAPLQEQRTSAEKDAGEKGKEETPRKGEGKEARK